MNFKEYFEYKDGQLYWKKSTNKKIKIGQIAGCITNKGYLTIKVNKKPYLAHVIIFAMHHGYFPKEIDHIDCNKLNNKIENLREATREQNQWNRKIQSNNTSGCKGVYWSNRDKTWRVAIRFNKKINHLGSFKDFELAELVAVEARSKFHGNFAKF